LVSFEAPTRFTANTERAGFGTVKGSRIPWYNAGFRSLWRHLRTTFGLEPGAQRKLESAAAYCRAQYITALIQEEGPEEAQRILDGEKPLWARK
jgi:hypothetical protein